MIKLILFDVDGIVIVGRKHLFSERLAVEHNISPELIQEFFEKDFRECSFGCADLKEKITPYLEKWGWKGTVEDILKYWFEAEREVNNEVLDIVKKIRSQEILCYIATRQEKYRMDYIWNEIGLSEHFDGYFSTCDIGVDKNDVKFFEYVIKTLPDIKYSDIFFLDDKQKNIGVAQKRPRTTSSSTRRTLGSRQHQTVLYKAPPPGRPR